MLLLLPALVMGFFDLFPPLVVAFLPLVVVVCFFFLVFGRFFLFPVDRRPASHNCVGDGGAEMGPTNPIILGVDCFESNRIVRIVAPRRNTKDSTKFHCSTIQNKDIIIVAFGIRSNFILLFLLFRFLVVVGEQDSPMVLLYEYL